MSDPIIPGDILSDLSLPPLGMESGLVFDLDDPLVTLFALQHDLRERFRYALEQIVKVVMEGDPDECGEAIAKIAAEALDNDSIRRWMDEGRPLPHLDGLLEEDVRNFDETVRLLLARVDGQG